MRADVAVAAGKITVVPPEEVDVAETREEHAA
jgi:hypothetical protein